MGELREAIRPEAQDLLLRVRSVQSFVEAGAVLCTRGRQLLDCDGVTLVVRDGDFCFYLEEDAIRPLWKGKRFHMDQCVSGWVMISRQPAIIPNIRLDPRIPQDIYSRTFVKSLLMSPVMAGELAVAAIGSYWSEFHDPNSDEVLHQHALARALGEAYAGFTR